MTESVQLEYDEGTREATLTFPNGRQLAIGNVTKEQAERFHARHAAEFQKRDCVLTTDGVFTQRSADG